MVNIGAPREPKQNGETSFVPQHYYIHRSLYHRPQATSSWNSPSVTKHARKYANALTFFLKSFHFIIDLGRNFDNLQSQELSVFLALTKTYNGAREINLFYRE
ncbi:hypothetical protein Peur_051176 [Populus x canadensis]